MKTTPRRPPPPPVRKPRYKLGDHVCFPFGDRTVTAVVTELRGGIGIGGRHLYQVRILMDSQEPMILEVPEDEVEPALKPA